MAMLACDVQYDGELGFAAGASFSDWDAPCADRIVTTVVRVEAGYVPGEFYRRELPCLAALIKETQPAPTILLIDGFVWLAEGRPALGARLYEELGKTIPIIGVAKSRLAMAGDCASITRGGSSRPLYVSAIGLQLIEALQDVALLHGHTSHSDPAQAR